MITDDQVKIQLNTKRYDPKRTRNIYKTLQAKESINALEADEEEVAYLRTNNTKVIWTFHKFKNEKSSVAGSEDQRCPGKG